MSSASATQQLFALQQIMFSALYPTQADCAELEFCKKSDTCQV